LAPEGGHRDDLVLAESVAGAIECTTFFTAAAWHIECVSTYIEDPKRSLEILNHSEDRRELPSKAEGALTAMVAVSLLWRSALTRM
jgi:hypothetical protein